MDRASSKAKPEPGYREEPQVDPKSVTETYVALKLAIDNWRWSGVPFYLRTGKRMAQPLTRNRNQVWGRSATDAAVPADWRQTPRAERARHAPSAERGHLAQLQRKGAQEPLVKLGGVDMNFKYADYFGAAPSIGYETLLLDCMIGDPTLFQRADTVDAGWRVVDPILDAWKATPASDFPNYAAGSWGPGAADELLKRDGRKWRESSKMISLREVLEQAEADKVAIGHFNFSDLAAFNAIVAAARERQLPVLLGVSEGEREFIGVSQAAALMKAVRDESGLSDFSQCRPHSFDRQG